MGTYLFGQLHRHNPRQIRHFRYLWAFLPAVLSVFANGRSSTIQSTLMMVHGSAFKFTQNFLDVLPGHAKHHLLNFKMNTSPTRNAPRNGFPHYSAKAVCAAFRHRTSPLPAQSTGTFPHFSCFTPGTYTVCCGTIKASP